MTRWAVTLLCVAGVAAAAVISWRHGRRPTTFVPRDPDETIGAWPGASRAIRSAAVAAMSGGITTALVLGFGGRLMMRVAAATSSESVQGLLTDADERVGEVTIGGTIGFVLFFTLFFGGAIGFAYALLRRFVPGPSAFAGFVVATIVAGIAGHRDFTDRGNSDFRILEPTWLIALMLLLLVVLFGTTLGATHAWLDSRLPRPSPSKDGLWYLALAPMALMPVNIVAIAFAGIGGAALPAAARDVWRDKTVVRIISAVVAAAFLFFGFRMAGDLWAIAF